MTFTVFSTVDSGAHQYIDCLDTAYTPCGPDSKLWHMGWALILTWINLGSPVASDRHPVSDCDITFEPLRYIAAFRGKVDFTLIATDLLLYSHIPYTYAVNFIGSFR